MYAEPQDLESEVFTRLPESLHLKGSPSKWAAATRPGAAVHSFLEGPEFDREGNLLCVDVAGGRILKVSPVGKWSVVSEYDGEPHGLALHRDGRLFIADFRHGILVLDGEGVEPVPVVDKFNGQSFLGCNDLVFAGDGSLFFSDSGWSSLNDPTGRIFRLDPYGKAHLLLDGIPYPNGLVTNKDESALLVAATYANAVWRVPLVAGTLARASLFIQLSGGLGPDGMALDSTGNLAIAHARNGAIWLFTADGAPLYRIRSCAGASVTSIAYGGDDLRTLFVTEADTGSILTARLPVPGRKTFGQGAKGEQAA